MLPLPAAPLRPRPCAHVGRHAHPRPPLRRLQSLLLPDPAAERTCRTQPSRPDRLCRCSAVRQLRRRTPGFSARRLSARPAANPTGVLAAAAPSLPQAQNACRCRRWCSNPRHACWARPLSAEWPPGANEARCLPADPRSPPALPGRFSQAARAAGRTLPAVEPKTASCSRRIPLPFAAPRPLDGTRGPVASRGETRPTCFFRAAREGLPAAMRPSRAASRRLRQAATGRLRGHRCVRWAGSGGVRSPT
jgi:hypothetical protein